MNQMIIEIDEGTELGAMPDDLKAKIASAKVQWDGSQMAGTMIVESRKLIMIISELSAEQMRIALGESGQNWNLVAAEGEKIPDHSRILAFMADMPAYNGESDAIEYVGVSSIVDKLPCWAGRSWVY